MKTINKLFLIIFLVFSSVLSVISQQVPLQQWVNTFNNPAGTNDKLSKIAYDNNGNVYMTGRADSNSNDGKTLTIKYSSNGNLAWTKYFTGLTNRASMGSGGMSVASDISGNVFVLAVTEISPSFYGATLIKYNSSGDTIWTRTLDTTSFFSDGGDIKIDASGNIYASYITGSIAHYGYLAVTKIQPNGLVTWQYYYQGTAGNHGIYPKKMVIDNTGNLYVTGRMLSYLGPGQYYFDGVTVKINNSGTQQWAAIYDGSAHYNDLLNDIALDASGNVYVTGSMTPASNKTYVVIIKYDGSTGGAQWTNTAPGTFLVPADYGKGIAVSQTGDVYVCGQIDYDAFVMRLNSSGIEQWRKFYPNNNNETFNAIKLDSSGNIFAAGLSQGATSFSMTSKYNQTGDMIWNTQYNPGVVSYASFLELIPGNSVLIAGEQGSITTDLFAVKYLQVTPQTITICRSINKPILDLQNTIDTLSVTGLPPSALIVGVQLKVDSLLHTYMYDLTATIKGPTGLVDTLFKRPGKPITGFNMIGCNITDTASHLLDTSAAAPFTGNFKPYKPLSSFSSNNPNGNWILNVYDGANGDTGSLRKYCLTISYFDPATIGIQNITNEMPKQYSLSQNYPNPFNPVTNIKFSIPNAGKVSLKVFDILGRQVAELVNDYRPAGSYLVDFNASSYASGVYFYRLETKDFSDVKKMVLVK